MDHAERLRRTRDAMARAGADALLVGPSADLVWLVGYRALPLERLTLLALPADGDAVLVVPTLEEARAVASGADAHARIVTWDEQEDPVERVRALLPDGASVLAVEDHLWSVFLLRLQRALPGSDWLPGSAITGPLRARKSPDEIRALAGAGAAIDAVHQQVPDLLAAGRTEDEVGRDIAELILDDHDEVNFVIVASGPNGASPHHETSERTIQVGEPVVIDIGGTRRGYCSDMTRDYVVGEPPDDYRRLHEVLEEAQRAGVEAVAPGVRAEEIDAICRGVIDDAGYGEHFIHRTGHGIGLEAHEDPYIVGGNRTPLEAGMAFSVEPGIYVPGRFGARIEDIVAVEEDGVTRLNRLPTGLVEVG